jgi:cellulose biosynthesis protein BcsQ
MEQPAMKTRLSAAGKGGTGGTALSCQFARYVRLLGKMGMLVIDLAEPASATASPARSCGALVPGAEMAVALAGEPPRDIPQGRTQARLARAMDVPTFARRDASARHHANVRHPLRLLVSFAGVCLIDCPPHPDSRTVCVEATVDATLRSILLSQEAFESAAGFIHGVQGVRSVGVILNPPLRYRGLLPNMVEETPFQQGHARTLEVRLGRWLIPHAQKPHGYLPMPRLDGIAKTQATGVPVLNLARSARVARMAWCAMHACFDVIARRPDWIKAHLPDGDDFNREVLHA